MKDLTESLILKLQQNDVDAAELLNLLYRTPLERFCRGYLTDEAEVEDVVQEVFLRVLQSQSVPYSFRAWIYRIARNQCLNSLRGQARRRNAETPKKRFHADSPSSGILSRLATLEHRERLRRRMNELPLAFREALRLRYTEGLGRAEIAQVLGVSESEVKNHLYRGLLLLKQHDSLRG